jgi:hypothetical protein
MRGHFQSYLVKLSKRLTKAQKRRRKERMERRGKERSS